MGLNETKLDLMQKLMTVNDSKLLKKVEKLLEEEFIVGYSTDGKPLTISEYNKRLEIAEEQINSGEFISQADLEKRVRRLVMNEFEIIWSNQAKNSLKEIYDYYKKKSPTVAKKIKNELLASPKAIYFSKQYQLDDINPDFRRIIIRHYKLLYKEKKNKIIIVDIISTRQSPEIFKDI